MRDHSLRCSLKPMVRLGALLLASLILAACGGETVDPDIARGRQLFAEHCTACHSLIKDVVIVGPSLSGIAARAAAESSEPREVIRRSVLQPQSEAAEGFSDLMPTDFEQKLVKADLEALLSYLLTLE